MRPGYNTKSVTIRVPAVIREELDNRIREGYGQTDVILDALCAAWGVKNPKPRIGEKRDISHGQA